MQIRKYLIKLSLSLALIFGTVFVWLFVHFIEFIREPLPIHKPLSYTIKSGATVHAIATDLYERELIDSPYFFVFLAYLTDTAKQLKSGEYLLTPKTNPLTLLMQFAQGKVRPLHFTIVEGWTFAQLMAAINHDPHLLHTLDKLTLHQSWSVVRASCFDGKGAKGAFISMDGPEGLFFPATYPITSSTTDVKLLCRAYRLMDKKIHQVYQDSDLDDSPYHSPYEVLIAASLIEKETALSRERPMVAGVLVRRLKKNMPLQIDSTVIYGLGPAYDGHLHAHDLHTDTPYNTYMHSGLPPTPIATPSLESIKAALSPDYSDNLYFVAKANGTLLFSKDLTSHRRAAKTYFKSISLPLVGRKTRNKVCPSFWYLSSNLRQLFVDASACAEGR